MAPSSPIIKICGLCDAASIEAAITAGADWLGFVFVPASPRFIAPVAAGPLIARVPTDRQRVGLFSNQPLEHIAATAKTARLDLIQLHGSESPDDIEAIRSATGRPVVVARGISRKADLDGISGLPADYLLLDASPPKGSTRTGGHGNAFDWSLLDGFDIETPWLLAGGLTPDNVASAVEPLRNACSFHGVDVSSGVEIKPGKKDPALIFAFVAAARAAMGKSF
ncbi:MAG: phosphoribosylanthranilate isomerase [Parvularcula sp.]